MVTMIGVLRADSKASWCFFHLIVTWMFFVHPIFLHNGNQYCSVYGMLYCEYRNRYSEETAMKTTNFCRFCVYSLYIWNRF